MERSVTQLSLFQVIYPCLSLDSEWRNEERGDIKEDTSVFDKRTRPLKDLLS